MTGRIRRPPSAVAAIGGFGIGVALLSVATTAAIVLVAPQPDGLRISIRDAAGALGRETAGFERRMEAEPTGRRAIAFEAALADLIRRPVADVRIVMTGPERLSAPPGSTERLGRLFQPPARRRHARPDGRHRASCE